MDISMDDPNRTWGETGSGGGGGASEPRFTINVTLGALHSPLSLALYLDRLKRDNLDLTYSVTSVDRSGATFKIEANRPNISRIERFVNDL